MKKAVALAQDAGLDVIFTLHDALYVEYNSGDYGAIDTLIDCMDRAFRFYIPEKLKHRANCRMDAETWGPDYTPGTVLTPKGFKVKVEQVHVDERAVDEYKQFSKYFTKVDHELL